MKDYIILPNLPSAPANCENGDICRFNGHLQGRVKGKWEILD